MEVALNSSTPREISVTDIGEYIRHRSCDRRFYLGVHYDSEVRKALQFFVRLLNTLDPVLQEVGRTREDQWESELKANGFCNVTEALPKGKRDEAAWNDFAAKLRELPPSTP